MTSLRTTQQFSHRLRAPREDRGVVVDPPWNDIPHALAENVDTRGGWEHDFQGMGGRQMIAQAREELRIAAVGWWCACGETRPAFDPAAPIILAGHQPQMFHPGVWLKNFALGRLAEKHGATAVNLIIDSDVAANPALFVPSGSAASPARESLAYDSPEPAVPYEERPVADRALFESFGHRAAARIEPFVQHPLLEKFWPLAIARSRAQDSWARAGASAAPVGKRLGVFHVGSSAKCGVRSAGVLSFYGAFAGPYFAVSADLQRRGGRISADAADSESRPSRARFGGGRRLARGPVLDLDGRASAPPAVVRPQ